MRLAPDGTRAAASMSEAGAALDIWMLDLKRNLRTRFTFAPGDDDDPVWSADGKTIYFDSSRSGSYNLYRKAADGSGTEELLLDNSNVKYPTSVSSDGRYLAYDTMDPSNKNQYDVMVLPLFGDKKPIPVASSGFSERLGVFSPDGKWMAYISNESGRTEVYVTSFPPTGAKFQISTGGGNSPKWRGDGKELFYYADDGHVVGVALTASGNTLQVGAATPLFAAPTTNVLYAFDVTRDGQHFLVLERPELGTNSLTLVVNWMTSLRK
jgi:Tol biopolymer transport system component